MIGRVIGAALLALLLAGPASSDAGAQTANSQENQPAAAPKAKAPAKAAAKSKTRAKKKTKSAMTEPLPKTDVSALKYPPCSRTVTDQCIQIHQRGIDKAYPQCAKIKNSVDKAACIEGTPK